MPTSVMPKGVEHTNFDTTSFQPEEMPTSVMPKGVEHIMLERVVARKMLCPPL